MMTSGLIIIAAILWALSLTVEPMGNFALVISGAVFYCAGMISYQIDDLKREMKWHKR
jgi:predicted membrane channel-forming protein YqfA (hemolysin III family)